MSKCLDPFRFLLISLAGWMKQQWPISTRPIKPRSRDRSHAGISHERLARRRYASCPRFWRLLFDPWSFRDTRRLANPEVSASSECAMQPLVGLGMRRIEFPGHTGPRNEEALGYVAQWT